MGPSSQIRIETDRGVATIRFLERRLFDDRTVGEVSEQLMNVLAQIGPGESLIRISRVWIRPPARC